MEATAASPQPRAPTTVPWHARAWIPAALLVAAVVIAYLPVRHAGFVWDDDSHLTANPCIVGSAGFWGIWASAAANYFPLATTTLWLLHAAWGLQPLVYHLANVLIHAAAVLLLWRVLLRLRVPGAWFGALLWALHPVQAESVAWISELKNTQSAVFYLLSILFFLRWLEPRLADDTARRNAAGAVCFGLSLAFAVMAILSKASTVMLPAILVVCTWWLAGRWRWSDLPWLAPFFALSAAASGWTIWEQQFHAGAIGPEWTLSLPARLIVAGTAPWFYLGKLLWPHPLTFIYPRWSPDAARFVEFLPLLATAALLAGLWLWRARLRPVLFAVLCFGVSLFPVLGFFSVYFFRYSYVADHFQYLASMAPLALAGALLSALFDRLQPAARWLRPAACALVAAVLGALTWMQTRVYADEATLWRATLEGNPRCWMACTNLGGLEVKAADYASAIGHLQTALEIFPGVPETEYNLGLAYLRTGRPAEALPLFESALRRHPEDPEVSANLGESLFQLSRVAEAVPHYRESLRINPSSAVVHNNLGNALLRMGSTAEGVAQLEEAVRLDPAYPEPRYNLAGVLLERGEPAEAAAHLRAVVRANPNDSGAQYNLGLALCMLERWADAVAAFEACVRLSPDSVPARSNLGNALLEAGRPREAIPHFEAALRLQPGLSEAAEGLAIARRQAGR